LKHEQLSFLEQIKQEIKEMKEPFKEYDASICSRCCCNRCKYSCEIYPFIDKREIEEIGDNTCFNCDDCYYYGMDNDSLSRNVVKFSCDKFEVSNYYAEVEARRRRRKFKMI